MIIDTHAHLHGQEYADDLVETVQRAREAGVGRVLLVGVDISDSRRALDTARRFDGFFQVIAGIHPHHAASWDATAESALRDELLRDPRVVAVGEIGLDYHYDFSPREKQREAFLGQLNIARAVDLPVVIHCREAYEDLLDLLENFYAGQTYMEGAPPRGVLHCYFGSVAQAERAARIGYLLGIGGSSTFKKAEELHEVIRRAPLSQLVLETDAPYMAPVPYRGKRNESSYLPLVAQRIAELQQKEPAEILDATTQNALRLFQIGPLSQQA